jgi:hypothetical protein
MDPNGPLALKVWNGSHPVSQQFPKTFLKEAPQKKVRSIEEQEKGEEDIIEEKDHFGNRNPKSSLNIFEIY